MEDVAAAPPLQPNLRCTWQAVEGKGASGEVVDTTIASTAEGESPAACSASRAASTARSDEAWVMSAHRRSRMPVSCTMVSASIRSAEAASRLETTRSGRYEPVPTILDRIMLKCRAVAQPRAIIGLAPAGVNPTGRKIAFGHVSC